MESGTMESPHSNETEITRQLDSPSPLAIHSFPSELLHEIFIAGSSQPPSQVEGISTVPFPILVSMVCKFWRTVAINSPCVWSTIFLPSTTEFDVLTFFERSKPAPLDVTMDTMVARNFGDNSDSFDRISRTILDNIRRLRSLKINVWSAEQLRPLVASFRDAEAPILHNLEVYLYTQEESHDFRNNLPIMTHTVALKSLKVKGVCVYCSPPLINLTFLDIDKFQPSESRFRDLFDACPSLSSLILRRFAAREHAVVPNQASLPIHASSLRSFAVSFGYGHSSPCTCPLHLFVLENIECIEISSQSVDLSGHFSSSMRGWNPNSRVRKLQISGIYIAAEEFLFIQSLPNTIDLELIGIYTNSDLYLPSVISLPNLHSITLELNKNAGVTGIADLSWLSRVVDQGLVKPTSPLIVCFSKLDEGDCRIQKIVEILGGHLTVQYSACKNALIGSNGFEFLDEDEDDWDYSDDESDFDASYELDVENEYGYDDEEDEGEDFW